MKIERIIISGFLIVGIGWVLYFAIGMSYTYPVIREYYFDANKVSFEDKLKSKIDSSDGWSIKKKDSIKRDDGVCYWASLFYERSGQDLEYVLKYCFVTNAAPKKGVCAKIGIVDIIDYASKSNNDKMSDENVAELVNRLDHTILNELAPDCKEQD